MEECNYKPIIKFRKLIREPKFYCKKCGTRIKIKWYFHFICGIVFLTLTCISGELFSYLFTELPMGVVDNTRKIIKALFFLGTFIINVLIIGVIYRFGKWEEEWDT